MKTTNKEKEEVEERTKKFQDKVSRSINEFVNSIFKLRFRSEDA